MEDSNNKVLKSNLDRIGALSDPVLHHILSFLDMKEVVQTRLLSTRWKNLWLSVPVLNFDHCLWVKKKWHKKSKRPNQKIGFMDFVNKVLTLHDGSSISRFDICCSAYCNSDQIDEWLILAARKQIPEVCLDFHSNEPKELPHVIFSSAITVFKFFGRHIGAFPIRIPNSVCSSQLKILVLWSVQLPEGDSNGELVLSCPVLQNLRLIDCYLKHLNVLNVCTLQLKNLVVENYYLERVGSCQIQICAPNLASLLWGSLIYCNCCLGSLSSLVTANIKFITTQKEEFLYGTPNTQNIVKVIEGVSSSTTIQVYLDLEYPHDPIEEFSCTFSNLRHLKLICNYYPDNSVFCLLLKLLKCSPLVETLVLEATDLGDYNKELLPFVFYHLKSVELGRFRGLVTELVVIKFFLENAAFLDKLKIKMINRVGVSVKEDFLERISSLPRASSNITILVI